MKHLLTTATLALILAAGSAAAQDSGSSGSGSGGDSQLNLGEGDSPTGVQQGATIGDEAACQAVQDRIQASLGQADRGLQSEAYDDVEQWTAIAANYADVYAAFCGN